MDISIILVNYNTRKLLTQCLDSIIEQKCTREYEVIVVDNNSSDDSIKILEDNYPWVKLLKSDNNLGFGKANNLGSNNATGKYLFYLNSDTILKNNALDYFYEFAEKNSSSLGAIGSILFNISMKPCHSYGNFITPKNELKECISRYLRFLKDKKLLHPPIISKAIEVDYITGADLFVPREVYDSIGGFDPDYFMYCEEVDWQKRMANSGLKRYIIPGPQIIHLEGGSDTSKTSIWSSRRLSNLRTSRKTYYKKHFNKYSYPIFLTLQYILEIPWKIALHTYYLFKRKF